MKKWVELESLRCRTLYLKRGDSAQILTARSLYSVLSKIVLTALLKYFAKLNSTTITNAMDHKCDGKEFFTQSSAKCSHVSEVEPDSCFESGLRSSFVSLFA